MQLSPRSDWPIVEQVVDFSASAGGVRPIERVPGKLAEQLGKVVEEAQVAWKEAEDTAFEAERCLYAAWDAYRCSGGSVPAHLQHRATMARALARRKLNEAIAAGKAAVQAGGCRPDPAGPDGRCLRGFP